MHGCVLHCNENGEDMSCCPFYQSVARSLGVEVVILCDQEVKIVEISSLGCLIDIFDNEHVLPTEELAFHPTQYTPQ